MTIILLISLILIPFFPDLLNHFVKMVYNSIVGLRHVFNIFFTIAKRGINNIRLSLYWYDFIYWEECAYGYT